MSSKIIRKKPKVAKSEGEKYIDTYQIISDFTRIPVAPDGNCFYTATGFFCGLNANQMREILMKYFIFKKAEYSIFFESQSDFIQAVRVNSNTRVWNSDLCDIVPHAAAQILQRNIIIHNHNGSTISEIHIPVEIGEVIYPPLHLFRSNDHYEILLDNTKNPNKNICPLADICKFYGAIDLTLDEDEPNIVDISSNDESVEICEDVCMIRF